MEFAPVQQPKGQPLQVFAIVLGGWLVLRVLLWEPPVGGAAPVRTIADGPAGFANAVRTAKVHASTMTAAPRRWSEPPPAPRNASERTLTAASRASAASPEPVVSTVSAFAGHPSHGTVPAPREASQVSRQAEFEIQRHPGNSRWSGDAWLLVREDTAASLVAGRPTYGRSQAGAVLRYRVSAVSGHRPTAYVRATRALAGPREREVAAGLAARPVPRLPVRVAAEVRVHEQASGRETRAAAFAVTELPPVSLPLGLRGELYAQAGYVGGRFATAFADGQLRVDRAVAVPGGGSELRLGGAVSGGAQKGAVRLDIGPSATVSFPVGGAYSRLALDYRFRIAGDAEPGNGPALTFSAGF
jgi:hypothetical protein